MQVEHAPFPGRVYQGPLDIRTVEVGTSPNKAMHFIALLQKQLG